MSRTHQRTTHICFCFEVFKKHARTLVCERHKMGSERLQLVKHMEFLVQLTNLLRWRSEELEKRRVA